MQTQKQTNGRASKGPAVPATVLAVLLLTNATSAIDTYVPGPPAVLSETGLYVPGSVEIIDPGNLPFSPQYPLWSDGAVKSRWIYLPPGTVIDASDVDNWRYPVGTRFWKQFVFAGRRVETRLLWHRSQDDWTFATYIWRPDQTDADLAPLDGAPRAELILEGKWHAVPSVGDCRACHTGGSNQVLGFGALQLSTDRDPAALHGEPLTPDMLTLRSLVERGWLQPVPVGLLDEPPRIRSQSPDTRSILGYLSANCGGCHNSEGPLARLGLDLRAAVRVSATVDADALVASLDGSADYQIPGTEPGTTRWIRPGAPELSSIVYRMASRRPSSQMPPLGTCIPDQEAIAAITRWTTDLAPFVASEASGGSRAAGR